jgi:spermidine/putrescine transport system ATP-binding protein
MTVYDVELKNIIKEFDSGGSTVRAVDDVSVQIVDGEFFALLGPSGCGKTTTLRMIAGFERPTSGNILIRGKAMEHIPAYHRPVNTVFQDYALFPHMTVIQNVMFGLQMEGVNKKDALKRAEDALEMVRLPDVGKRKPNQLSGGQQQRIALARSLVKRPAVLLLDEPLGALDLKLRKNMQYELKAMQRDIGITFIYVTHDQEEAITMADRIAVMSDGKMLQVGTPKEIYERPTTHFVADFIGETNFVPAILENRGNDGFGKVRLSDGTVIDAELSDALEKSSGDVTVAIRPERIGIAPSNDDLGFDNTDDMTILPAKLVESQYIGTDTRYTVQIANGIDLVARLQNVDYKTSPTFDAGQSIKVFWHNESTTVLDR